MGSGNQTQVVFMKKVLDNVSAERIGHTTIILTPTGYVLNYYYTSIRHTMNAPKLYPLKRDH